MSWVATMEAMIRTRVTGALMLGAVLTAWLAGCVGSLDQIDRQTQALIEERQRMALGVEAVTGDELGPVPNDDGTFLYDYNPPTNNPPASDLPAEMATTTEAVDFLRETEAVMNPPTPEALRLDLGGILAYAIENAPEYRNEKEGLYLETLALIVERHEWGPRFFDTVTAAFDGTPEGGDNDLAFSLVNDFAVTQRLPYGGRVSAGALVSYVNLLQQQSGSTDADQTLSAELQFEIDLPLLRGAGMVAREPLIQAERDLLYAVRDFERFRRAFLVDIANSYFTLILDQQRIENREAQVVNLQRLADRFIALAEAGKAAYFQAERAESDVLLARSDLVEERDDYAASVDLFKLVVGMPTTQDLVIVPSVVVVPDPELDPAEAVVRAWDFRLDLQNSADQVDDAKREVKIARNQLLPDLDLFANVNVPTDPDRDQTVTDFDLGDGSFSAGAVFGVPLDRKIEMADYRASLIQLERSQRNHQVFSDRVALQVRQSIREIRQAQINVALNQRSVEINIRRNESVRLRERTLGPRDVADAQQALLTARNRRDRAVTELRRSVLRYLLNTGQMRVSAAGQWLPPAKLVPVDDLGGEDAPLPVEGLVPEVGVGGDAT